MIKLMEDKLLLIGREKDTKIIEGMLKDCQKQYAELMKRETGRDYGTVLEVVKDDFLAEDCCGGVILMSSNRKIVCKNTIDARLQLVYDQILPEIRAILFPL